MKNQLSFPSGIALGEDFCNRSTEKLQLKQSILNNQHVVLVSPRRYGKTSLILQVLNEYQLQHCVIDFLPATHLDFIKNAILSGVSTLLTRLLPVHKKVVQKLLNLFESLNPRITLSAMGQQVELKPQQPSQKSIMDALLRLDELAQMFKKRVVFVLDEFQQVGILSQAQEIEASIRHAVERSQYVTYVFSGSNRHLLTQMFNDKRRPLYHLCDLMKLGRISKEEYAKFLQVAANKRWKKTLSNEVITEITQLTECHTYYVNALCRKLWKLSKIPAPQQVKNAWHDLIAEQYSWIASDVGELSVNQRLILAALAYEPTQAVQGQVFCRKVKLVPASVKRAIDMLLEKDWIFQDQNGFYKVLDPATLMYLRGIKFFSFNGGY